MLGAIFTDKVVVQCLTDFVWVGLAATLNEQHCHHLVHILHSYGRSILKLRNYYLGLQLVPVEELELHPCFLSSICAYHNPTGGIINFKYIKPLEHDLSNSSSSMV